MVSLYFRIKKTERGHSQKTKCKSQLLTKYVLCCDVDETGLQL